MSGVTSTSSPFLGVTSSGIFYDILLKICGILQIEVINMFTDSSVAICIIVIFIVFLKRFEEQDKEIAKLKIYLEDAKEEIKTLSQD
ncbi:hypothetical protein [Holdemania sp. Marseille-P2844]|uniref:hypothetical protein n=1 Tax=Holdemania sp. Marseille-P2844 TaxID=1852366 RepID=UPI001114E4FB|nr:hypothetical protein [Holdemania sp. Marseille-P2844]